MTTTKIKAHLCLWEAQRIAMDAQIAALEAVAGKNPEGPLVTCLGNLFATYTETLDELLDAGDWLQWYWIENDGGKVGLEAGYDGDVSKIRSLDDLCRLIETARDR